MEALGKDVSLDGSNGTAADRPGRPPITRRQRARYYLAALKGGIARLPEKRRANRALRRRGSLALLPVLLRPVKPLPNDGRRVSKTAAS